MQSAEPVDLVLVLATDLDLVAGRLLVLFPQLFEGVVSDERERVDFMDQGLTMRRFIVPVGLVGDV